MNMLDGGKRVTGDCNDSTPKKRAAYKSEVYPDAPTSIVNANCTAIGVAANNASGLANALKASLNPFAGVKKVEENK